MYQPLWAGSLSPARESLAAQWALSSGALTLFGTVAGRGCDMVLSLSLPVCLTLLTLLPPSQQACPGLYPHPSQCDKFYQCDSHSSYLFNCPQGTLFDVNIGVCNHKYLVKCQHESQTATREGTPNESAQKLANETQRTRVVRAPPWENSNINGASETRPT